MKQYDNGYFDNSIDENEKMLNSSDFLKEHKAEYDRISDEIIKEWDLKLPSIDGYNFESAYNDKGQYYTKVGFFIKDEEDNTKHLMVNINPENFEIIEVENIFR